MQENQNSNQFTLSMKNICYTVKVKDKITNQTVDKMILNEISGTFYSGNITAIMGPSGSGKSSLLNYITDNISFKGNSRHSGEFFLNSDNIEPSYINKFSGFVMQDDLLNKVLTPFEILRYVAQLRNSVPEERLDQSVNEIINQLKLSNCKDTRVGSAYVKGISGGERKRVSIGIELISNPAILFLDEPTSGLDSQTSHVVISLLRELAISKNKMIVTVIHQPSSSIYQLFDKVMVLNRGRIVYNGASMEVLDYFDSINRSLAMKSNPADAVMHVIETGNDGEQPDYLANQFSQLCKPKVLDEVGQIVSQNLKNSLTEKDLSYASTCKGIAILTSRLMKTTLRDPMTFRVRIMFVIIFSFIFGSIWYQLDYSELGVFNRVGLLFTLCINIFFNQVFNSITTFPAERKEFIREYNSNLYGVVPYYVSKNLVDTPFSIITMMLFVTIVYFLAGLRLDVENFFIFFLIYILHAFISQSIGYCIGTLFKTVEEANLLANVIVMPLLVLGGFFINPDNMPVWLFWIRYISPFYYSFQAAAANEFFDNPYFRSTVLSDFTVDMDMWHCIIIVFCLSIFIRVLGCFFLKLMASKTG